MTTSEECCPVFDPTPYENNTIEWENKLFIKDSMPTFLHMPLFGVFGKTVTRMVTKIESAGAKPVDKDFIMLCTDPSPWKSELFINVTKEVPNAANVKLSGTYLTRVYDGPFNNVQSWIKDLKEYTLLKKKKLKNMYFYYTSCPACAKKHGHNYVVGFADVE